MAVTHHQATPPRWRPLGRYELGPRLAAGGMAELYIARTPELHGFRKYVAIKRILPSFSDDREFVEMFLDEARLAAQLDHPNVVHVHDIGEDDDGLFFAMDYLHGQNLLAIMRRHRARGTFLPWDAFVALGTAAAAGLHHAHERRGFDGQRLGIIHRDVSPTNILVTYEGAVKLVDFGIAKASTSRHSTGPSVRKGKMAYMSPEQCRGDSLDPRSDVFALGVVLFELATLTRAFTGDGEVAVMNQIVNHPLAPPSTRRPDVPEELDRILARAVARDPQQRYASARELQRDLDEFAVDAGLLATPETLAAMMDELFGATPYPWQIAAEEGATVDAEPAGAREGEATNAEPTVLAPTTVHADPRAVALPPTRRRSWVIGSLVIGSLAVVAWIATPRDEVSGAVLAPQPSSAAKLVDDEGPPTPTAPVVEAATPSTGAIERPKAPDPAPDEVGTTSPPLEATPTPSPAPTPTTTPDRPTRPAARPRTSTPRPPPKTTPALPEPFDPDAPAPRVR